MKNISEILKSLDKYGGVLNIFKEKGKTSFFIVGRVKKILENHFGIKNLKVGHAGTLDPFATGVLVVAFGNWTKKISEFQNGTKTYVAKVKVGVETDTLDSDGKIIFQDENEKLSVKTISKLDLQNTIKNFVGEVSQIPPKFSAIKINGKRAYDLARKNENFEIPKRVVQIHSIKILDFSEKEFSIEVVCERGTYIRTLVSDIGKSIKMHFTCWELKRTKVKEFKIEDSIDLKL